jgi:NADH:ubiquinone oxidoreductase subunit F (NADH-binding)
MGIFEKVKQANIVGRGGAAFPAWIKWKIAKKTKADVKYVICNSSEGELGLFKDLYVWRNHCDDVIKGMVLLMDFLKTKEAYIHINENYYKELKADIQKEINNYKGYNFHISIEEPSYIGGESSTVLNMIEGNVAQPRSKKTRTAEKGLFEKPTVIQNVETLYDIARVDAGTYDGKRFSGIHGDGVKKKKVVAHDANASIKKILEEAGMMPDFDFYVQIGGSASGPVFDKKQIGRRIMTGAGSIEIFDKKKWNDLKWLKRLFKFYVKESCGKCAPCREGSFQLDKLIKKAKKVEDINWKEIKKIYKLMGKTSFCGLGKGILEPLNTYIKNVKKKK